MRLKITRYLREMITLHLIFVSFFIDEIQPFARFLFLQHFGKMVLLIYLDFFDLIFLT